MATIMNAEQASTYFPNSVYSFATMEKSEAESKVIKCSFPL